MRNAQCTLDIRHVPLHPHRMAPRSAADTVVLTDAFRDALRHQRAKLNADGKKRRSEDAQLSRAGLAALLDNCDPSTIARWESGQTKAIQRDTVDELAILELPSDEGKLYSALGILPKVAERKLFVFRRALGSTGLSFTLDAIRRIEAGLIAEEVYSTDTLPVPTPVPDRVLSRIGKINRRTFVARADMTPDTPLVAFTPTRARSHSPDQVDVIFGLPDDLASSVYQFTLAHAAAHRVLGHDECRYLPAAGAPPRANEPRAMRSEDELMANDVAVRLLAPSEAVNRAYSGAVAAIARADDQADFWETGPSDAGGQQSLTWSATVTRVASALNVPGWLALRRLEEERLMDVPAITRSSQ